MNPIRLTVVGGPDVDLRIPIMERWSDRFALRAIGSEPALASRFADAGFPYDAYPLASAFDLAADLRSVAALYRRFREQQPDLVQTFDTKPNIVARWAARAAGVPVVVGTVTGLGGLYASEAPRVRRRRSVFEWLHTRVSERADWTVFQNEDDRRFWIERGVVPPGRSSVIPGSGVPADRFDGSDSAAVDRVRREFEIPATSRVVLYVGRWMRAKGLLDLMEAVPRIERGTSDDVVVVALGAVDPGPDGLTEAECERVRAHSRAPGHRPDLESFLALADVVVLPSRYREGVPRALIEAALAGVPIVTTDTPGCRDVVADGAVGWIVPPGAPVALADAVVEVLADPSRALRVANAAKERARTRFELGGIADQYRTLYDRLLAAREGALRSGGASDSTVGSRGV